MNLCLESWAKWLAAGSEFRRPVREGTVEAYLIKIRGFLAWLETRPEPEITPALLYQYVGYLQRDLRRRPRTIHQAFAALYRLFGYLEEQKLLPAAPSRHAVKLPALDQPLRYAPSDRDVEAIWTVAERFPVDSFHARFVRQRALTVLAVLRYAGLRNFEVRALDVGDVRLEETRLYVACGKGGTSDWLPVIKPLEEQLRLWLPLREEWLGLKEGECREAGLELAADVRRALFPVNRVHRLGERALLQLFRDLCRVAFGDERRMTPHCMKHYFGTTLHKLGVPDVYLARLCRHANVAITKAIYCHAADSELAGFLSRLEIQTSGVERQNGAARRPEPPRPPGDARRPRRQAPGTSRQQVLGRR